MRSGRNTCITSTGCAENGRGAHETEAHTRIWYTVSCSNLRWRGSRRSETDPGVIPPATMRANLFRIDTWLHQSEYENVSGLVSVQRLRIERCFEFNVRNSLRVSLGNARDLRRNKFTVQDKWHSNYVLSQTLAWYHSVIQKGCTAIYVPPGQRSQVNTDRAWYSIHRHCCVQMHHVANTRQRHISFPTPMMVSCTHA